MWVKKRKFKRETTATDRLIERWDQQVFFIMRKFPHAASAISKIRESHSRRHGVAFAPSEESLAELSELQVTLS